MQNVTSFFFFFLFNVKYEIFHEIHPNRNTLHAVLSSLQVTGVPHNVFVVQGLVCFSDV